MGKSSTSIKKKQVLNPTGRPKKGCSMREAFINYFQSQAPKEKKGVTRFIKIIEVLENNATEKKDTVAAKYISDQVIGKARETVDANVSGDIKITINKIVDDE